MPNNVPTFKKATPKGTAVYPRLAEPDRKFNPMGTYQCALRMDGSDPKVQQWMDEFRSFEEEAYKAMCQETGKPKLKRAYSPLRPVEDEDGNPTGDWQIRAKMTAHVETSTGKSWDQRPLLFDSKLKPVNAKKVNLGGGSTIRMSIDARPFFTAAVGAGISVRLRSVQVFDLVEYVPGGDPKDHGFEEEDGFEVEEAAEGSEDFQDDSEGDY